MKHVVSVSLSAAKRDTCQEVTLLGERVRLERRGTDGDLTKAARLLRELDENVDAFGLGGTDLYLRVGKTRYTLRAAMTLADNAKTTPVVCGAGLKDTLEPLAIKQLAAQFDWPDKKVLMVSSVDRMGMAEALQQSGAEVVYGDALFVLGLPYPIRRLETVTQLARLILPLATKLPLRWLYPLGDKQNHAATGAASRYYGWADVIAGDFHYIKRFAPTRLDGKTILTQTTTPEDVADLAARGVAQLITTTPRYGGRSVATNLLEAALVALSGRYPLTEADYLALIARAGLGPTVQRLG